MTLREVVHRTDTLGSPSWLSGDRDHTIPGQMHQTILFAARLHTDVFTQTCANPPHFRRVYTRTCAPIRGWGVPTHHVSTSHVQIFCCLQTQETSYAAQVPHPQHTILVNKCSSKAPMSCLHVDFYCLAAGCGFSGLLTTISGSWPLAELACNKPNLEDLPDLSSMSSAEISF